ncbi:MAG: hypothetical protein JW837_06595 [Sedimentisphaerales bacterium]|nr:hypothetical protein [Sedimentisphaerales bacterium]
MRDIFRKPIFYYILTPVMAGLWPLLVWAVYLPAAEDNKKDLQDQFKKAEPIMMEILTLDPDRRDYTDSNDVDIEFTFDKVVARIASASKIPPSKYKLNSGMLTTSNNQKSQSATVSLKQIDIVKFAEFLSTIQLRWANLQCNRVKLSQKQGIPDMWDVDIEFKYYY